MGCNPFNVRSSWTRIREMCPPPNSKAEKAPLFGGRAHTCTHTHTHPHPHTQTHKSLLAQRQGDKVGELQRRTSPEIFLLELVEALCQPTDTPLRKDQKRIDSRLQALKSDRRAKVAFKRQNSPFPGPKMGVKKAQVRLNSLVAVGVDDSAPVGVSVGSQAV